MLKRAARVVLPIVVLAISIPVLYGAASFPTSVKSFTSRVAGDTIQPAHINDIQDEVTAVETQLLAGATSYVPTWTNGVIGNGTLTGSYTKIGKVTFFSITLTAGTTTTFGGGSAWTFSLPVTAASTNGAAVSVSLDNSASTYYTGGAVYGSTTTVGPVITTGASTFTSALPFAWATADTLKISGWFIAA